MRKLVLLTFSALTFIGLRSYSELKQAKVINSHTPTPTSDVIQTRTPDPTAKPVVKAARTQIATPIPTPQPTATSKPYVVPTYKYPTTYVPPTAAPVVVITTTPYPTNTPTPTVFVLSKDKWYYCSMTLQRTCERDQFNPDCQKKYTDETYYCPHGGTHTIAGLVEGLQDLGLNDCVCIF